MSAHSVMLPYSFELNIAALSRLFADTTNSYKFILFLSYLDILRRRDFTANEPISFQELIVEMLANSWYPHVYFRLSFGLQDQITSKLDFLRLEISEPIMKFKDSDKRLLRETISKQPLDNSLMRYVPYRLLRPFFDEDLRGLPEYKINSTIVKLAAQHFTDRRPLYCFGKNQDSLIPHPVWAEYFKIHYVIIKSWTAWNWLEYMQKCNQGVPAVSSCPFGRMASAMTKPVPTPFCRRDTSAKRKRATNLMRALFCSRLSSNVCSSERMSVFVRSPFSFGQPKV